MVLGKSSRPRGKRLQEGTGGRSGDASRSTFAVTDTDSGWNFKTLKKYFERVLTERELRYKQMFNDAKDALIKAEVALREYKATANEFRGTLQDQALLFMPRTESENTAKELRSLIEAQNKRVTSLEIGESRDVGGTQAKSESKTNNQWIISLLVGLMLGLLGYFIAAKK
jgi:hypothetical protein